jgi:hypothetical protein
MHAKNNRQNKDFQIAYFLAGSCHTYDGAYSLLKDLQEDREMALAQLESADLRTQAQKLKAQRLINSSDEVDVLEGKAILADIKNNKKFTKRNTVAAKKELEFINKCIEKIQPLRKFSNLTDPEAHEAAQFDEWKLELIHRAENYLLTSGHIPSDHFTTMRQHPAFKTEILPAIEEISSILKNEKSLPGTLDKLDSQRLDLPKLLEFK